ncbi:MAG: O-antigen ligase family protein [Cyanobacteria bacterium J06648_16]
MDLPAYSATQANRAQPVWSNALVGAGLLGLVAFAWLPDSFFSMVGWPWITIWQGAFLLVAFGCWGQLRRFQQPFRGLGAGLDWVVLGLALSLAIASALAPSPLLAFQNSLLVVFYGVLLYALRNSWLRPQQLWQGLVGVGAIAAIISLVLWRPSPEMWLSDGFHTALRNRFPLGHHNFSGGYFVLVLPLAAGLARAAKGWQRWAYSVATLVTAAALYSTGSRGAWLGALVILVVALGQRVRKSEGRARRRAIAITLTALGLATLLLASNPRVRTLVGSVSLRPELTQVVADGPTRDRIYMAQAAVNIFERHPLTGVGPGNLGRVYDRYRPIAAGTGLKQVQQLHNTPLNLLSELGLIGFGVLYIWGLSCLLRLWLKLRRTLTDPVQQILLGCLGLGGLGYGVSSLTDYQLENIPIALTLTGMLAALVKLQNPTPLAQSRRRWVSLILLIVVGLTLQFWLRTSLSLWLTHQGIDALKRDELTQADDKFYTATVVAPWDPTPSALGAQQLSDLAQGAAADSQDTLRSEAIALYRKALAVSPDDIWFNQNLAVLTWQQGDVDTAQRAISRVVQLNPRSENYSYYLLGLTYLSQGQTDAAIAAFALEMLINPGSITLEAWQQDLSALAAPVFARLQQHYQTLLAELAPARANVLEQQLTAVRWWSGEQLSSSATTRPLMKALLEVEDNPKQAVDQINNCLQTTPADQAACRLLKAWLQPEIYLPEFLEETNLSATDQAAITSHITTHRNLREWLRSATQPVAGNRRFALALLYRNQYANQINQILLPGSLRRYTLPSSLRLLPLSWPREILPLDTLVETIRTEQLDLPHPTR